MLYGIGKLCASRILLRRQDNGFGAIHLIYFIYSFVELLHVGVVGGIEGEEVGLDG